MKNFTTDRYVASLFIEKPAYFLCITMLPSVTFKIWLNKKLNVSEFIRKLIAIKRPEKNPVYGINDIVGVRHLSKLRP